MSHPATRTLRRLTRLANKPSPGRVSLADVFDDPADAKAWREASEEALRIVREADEEAGRRPS